MNLASPMPRPLRALAVATAVLLGAAACGGGDEPAEPATTTSSVSAPATQEPTAAETGDPATTDGSATTDAETTDVRTLHVQVAGGRVEPPPAQVDLAVGETLRVVVTSDQDSEVHAHGFEVEAPVPAGEPTEIDITGETPGVYEVELHHPDLLLLQVAVR